jgi:two-component system, NarL family, sensor kinase
MGCGDEAPDRGCRLHDSSAARRVSVSVDGNEDEIRFEVSDDGVGFDPDAAMKGPGLGLIGMRERLIAVGGDCVISSRRGAGARIVAQVPIRRGRAEAANERSE